MAHPWHRAQYKVIDETGTPVVGFFEEAGSKYHATSQMRDRLNEFLDEPPAFDVEEYRADLQRRYDSLVEAAGRDHYDWMRFRKKHMLDDYNRKTHKADGIQIALDLLPRVES